MVIVCSKTGSSKSCGDSGDVSAAVSSGYALVIDGGCR